MATVDRYARELDALEWEITSEFPTNFQWEYEAGSAALRNLYRKGKRLQWDADTRIDWDQDLDPENPQGLPDEGIILSGSPVWDRMTKAERSEFRRHIQSWQVSQFLHGEQGALVCTAKIVQQVPSIDAKFYAATQVMDEARHVEAYARLLHDKFELAYPINPQLQALLNDVLADARWDMTYLGMQVLVEGLALAAFANIRDNARNPLAASVNAYVMQDEARHVAFGRLALREYYPHLGDAERDEREEFAVEACYLMRDRLLSREVFETLGLPVDACVEHATNAPGMREFRSRLFTRIVPTMQDIGLWGPRIQKAYADMGILGYADVDAEAMRAQDERVALEFDARAGRGG